MSREESESRGVGWGGEGPHFEVAVDHAVAVDVQQSAGDLSAQPRRHPLRKLALRRVRVTNATKKTTERAEGETETQTRQTRGDRKRAHVKSDAIK